MIFDRSTSMPSPLLPGPGTSARSRRVLVLLAGVLVLSAADLLVTLVHLRTIGMLEANPIAAWIIRTTGSPWALAAYKIATVAVCTSLIFRLRRHRSGEAAAWCAVLILAGMSVLWHHYSHTLESPTELRIAQTEHADQWLRLD